MRKILSYFALFITSFLWLHTNIRLWASAKDRLFLLSRPVWDGVAEPSFTADTHSWIWCWLEGMDKTSPAHLTEWWCHQNQVLSFHSALLHRVTGFLFSFGDTTASKFAILLQTAGSRQVLQDFQITCMLKEGHAQVWSHAASIKEQFTWFPRMAAAVCRMSRRGFLRSPMWIWSKRMKTRDLGDTDSSSFISRRGFLKVVNPRFALCQPSAGIFSLTAVAVVINGP